MLKICLEKDGYKFIADEIYDGFYGYYVTDGKGNWWYSYSLHHGNWDEIDDDLRLRLEQEYQGEFLRFYIR